MLGMERYILLINRLKCIKPNNLNSSKLDLKHKESTAILEDAFVKALYNIFKNYTSTSFLNIPDECKPKRIIYAGMVEKLDCRPLCKKNY